MCFSSSGRRTEPSRSRHVQLRLQLVRVRLYCFHRTANLSREAHEIQEQCLGPRPERGVGPGAVLYCPLAGACGAASCSALRFFAIVNYFPHISETAPEDEELERKKASLAELEAELADRELELDRRAAAGSSRG